jgi:hypothetical protein
MPDAITTHRLGRHQRHQAGLHPTGATACQATAGPTNGPLTVLAVQAGRLYRLD